MESPIPTEIQCHEQCETMLPIGPSASGQVDWSPMAGLTGIRPVVNQCSITRYSTNEWQLRNQSLIECATTSMGHSVK
jgi:tektin-4